tara:strand:- start:8849 stop:9142 length:294 start_codon:yes stop_codon:yes gene_type:complete
MKINNQANKIRSINSAGWDSLESEEQIVKNEPTDLDKSYHRTFNSEDGQKVLQHLISITIDQPAWMPGADPSYGYAREGQNSLIREIKQRMRRCINE